MSHFASDQFASQQFASEHFGVQSVEAPAQSKGSGSSYDEYFRRQYEEQRILEDDDEIIEIVKILLKQGIL